MAYRIEKNIPIPRQRRIGEQEIKNYPFGFMDVGDSFWAGVPLNKLSAAARNFGKRNKMKFTCRTEGDGARVWRTE